MIILINAFTPFVRIILMSSLSCLRNYAQIAREVPTCVLSLTCPQFVDPHARPGCFAFRARVCARAAALGCSVFV